MPSNLNALIRYKQIDRCLRNKYVDCTIARMQQMCSEQLKEYRGIYKGVSERTIRDDIKTMRGDSLGFNAPIVVKKGVYSYSEEGFSIFDSSIDDIDLLRDIMFLLLEEKDNISSSNLNIILKILSKKTGIDLPNDDEKITKEEFTSLIDDDVANTGISLGLKPKIDRSERSGLFRDYSSFPLFSWKYIFNLFR